ncbi:MAG TPA: hypothetical protein VGY54_15515 [Polyangiaceae bacterium]|jgi:hypothetical protein|nr:hypothetical protein [Polyangiaceae bacterium]
MDKDELARRERAERIRKRIRERVEQPKQGERTPATPRELADEEAEKARREKNGN